MLEPLGSELWFADGGVVSFKGFAYPTRMVIVRLADGGLWLWSPVQRSAALEGEVRALGPVRHIVSPNKLHYLFLGEWQTAFPDASLWATPATIAETASSASVAEIRSGVTTGIPIPRPSPVSRTRSARVGRE